MPREQVVPFTKHTVTGLVTADSSIVKSLLVTTDGVNDPTISLYNSEAADAGYELFSTTFDASALGLNGFVDAAYDFDRGTYIVIANIGTGFVTIGSRSGTYAQK